ncbi:N-carbamoylputrescine amidase [Caenispirillum salinarum AK4]|uniref:N-carbamoylputrescine amidase n=1 Tax=Caenispirillum salinarum AK4 TaxID=1238182 RepID=K9HHN8_9PROT|nr:N-carbamoylputrescine amidase [Caenispirillum salinarum]EKV28121.1 N-carbamoylputrescine amidase [Caenispirillum salinarum AK4]
MSTVKVAATQFACAASPEETLDKAEAMVRRAADQGARIILLQELFETPYFCKDQDPRHFALARTVEDNPVLARFAALAKELSVVLPFSFYERAGQAFYNSLAVLDADGANLGVYRKSHIPQGPGYEEKYYFSPGDTGFRVFKTAYATIGCGICWDQWFPEAARAMALLGAEILFYPTAIGTEPHDATIDSMGHWQRVMQGHAGANVMPLVASNRVGREVGTTCELTFYGSSFIADQTGAKVTEADRREETVLTAEFDLAAIRDYRAAWGLFRDRRPDLYGVLAGLDGRQVR